MMVRDHTRGAGRSPAAWEARGDGVDKEHASTIGEEIAMQRRVAVILRLLVLTCILSWHVHAASGQATGGGLTLFDGTNLDHWNHIGDANWRLEDGVVVADKGSGYLVSKESYTDFQFRVEFWVDEDANSGVFIRCTNPDKVGSDSGYEVNIYDTRPDPSYGTGAIVNVAKVEPMPKAGG